MHQHYRLSSLGTHHIVMNAMACDLDVMAARPAQVHFDVRQLVEIAERPQPEAYADCQNPREDQGHNSKRLVRSFHCLSPLSDSARSQPASITRAVTGSRFRAGHSFGAAQRAPSASEPA